jgi:hypothetical protein
LDIHTFGSFCDLLVPGLLAWPTYFIEVRVCVPAGKLRVAKLKIFTASSSQVASFLLSVDPECKVAACVALRRVLKRRAQAVSNLIGSGMDPTAADKTFEEAVESFKLEGDDDTETLEDLGFTFAAPPETAPLLEPSSETWVVCCSLPVLDEVSLIGYQDDHQS